MATETTPDITESEMLDIAHQLDMGGEYYEASEVAPPAESTPAQVEEKPEGSVNPTEVKQDTPQEPGKEPAEETGEHFDSVLVIGSWSEENKTHRVFGQSGNWFTCIGMAHDFLESSSQVELAGLIADAIADKEGWEGDDA